MERSFPFVLLPLLIGILCGHFALSGQDTISILYPDSTTGIWNYRSDTRHNRIPDFSYAGYQKGEVPLPEVVTKMTLSPVDGDNTRQIQEALDSVGSMPADSFGVRGAVQLLPGTYEIWGTINLRSSGVVLRGTSTETVDSGTILLGVGNTPEQRNLIQVGNSSVDWRREISDSRANITSLFLPAGSRTIELERTGHLQVGDKVMVVHPSTAAWLASISFGETADDTGWNTGEIDIYYNREIEEIYRDQNKIILDAPIYDHLDQSLAQAYLYRWHSSGLVRNSGVEDLTIVIQTEGEQTENHVWTAVELRGVEDCWVTGIEARHFGYAAVNVTMAHQVSVLRCKGLQPHSLVTGARRYNFAANRFANNILFQHCEASWSRHAFICNAASSGSGIVFSQCTARRDLGPSEGHRRWSQALLYDAITFDRPEDDRVLGLYNRGSFGTGHGWGAVHSVAWNISIPPTAEMVLQRPPGRQNYAIGVQGRVTRFGPFTKQGGWQALINRVPDPPSLYDLQLQQRLTHGPLPDAPAMLQYEHLDNDSIRFNWLDISAREVGYIVEVSQPDEESFIRRDTLPVDATEWIVASTDLGMEVSVRISALMQTETAHVYSNEIKVERTASTRNSYPVRFEVFPNPSSDFLWISAPTHLKEIDIYSLDGQRMLNLQPEQQGPHRLSLTALPSGVYTCVVSDHQGRHGRAQFVRVNP